MTLHRCNKLTFSTLRQSLKPSTPSMPYGHVSSCVITAVVSKHVQETDQGVYLPGYGKKIRAEVVRHNLRYDSDSAVKFHHGNRTRHIPSRVKFKRMLKTALRVSGCMFGKSIQRHLAETSAEGAPESVHGDQPQAPLNGFFD